MKKIKNWAATLAVCASIMGLAFHANAISFTIGDSSYLGSINPGVPPGGNELNWVNIMVGLPVSGSTNNVSPGNQTITRSSNDFGSLNAATDENKRDNSNPTWIVASDSLYLLGKYGSVGGEQFSHVWYLGNLAIGTEVVLPTSALSHSTIMTGERTTRVPDGGSTLALIGLAATGLAFMRRKMA